MTRRAAPDTRRGPGPTCEPASAVTTLTSALARTWAASRLRLERLSTGLYDRHADRCPTCCVLGGEFCRTGHRLHLLAARLETERLW